MAERQGDEQMPETSGMHHPNPERVQDPLFRRHPSFFDSHDLVQVKYEMLRSHHVDGLPVSEAARRFGLSRQTFYLTAAAFQRARLRGLLPGRPGPKGPRKLTPEMVAFVRSQRRERPELGYRELAAAVADRFAIHLHPRTLRRLVERKKHSADGTPPRAGRRGGLPPTGGSPAADV
jgi:transposase